MHILKDIVNRTVKESWTDSQLIESIKLGDREAFGILYNKYSDKMYNAAYVVLKDKELCEDIVHELFVNIWVTRATFNIVSAQSYLLVAVRNRVISVLRKKTISIDISSIEDTLSDFQSVDNKLLTDDIQKILEKNIESLPPKCQQIFVMSREEQLPNKEIAAKLNITVKTVENQITIALKRIRSSLDSLI